jgi:hypothetical protein
VNKRDDQKLLYTVGGVAALLIAAVALLDIIISFLTPAASVPGTRTAVQWFALYQENRFLGLRELGLLNMLNLIFTAPLFLALYAAHRRAAGPFAALAAMVWAIGAAVYIANNTALPMLTLSGQYAAATTEAQRTLLVGAGQALLAQGEDLTAGTFTGFFLTEVAGIMMATVVLRSRIFSRWTGWAGILGFTFLLLFNVGAAFVPSLYSVALTLAMIGGTMCMVWYILAALRLFRLGRPDSRAPDQERPFAETA